MAASTSEFRRGWTVLVASSLGVAFGASPIPYNSLGPFTVPLTSEFGWGRGEMQLAVFWFTIAVVCIVPVVGGLADRFGVRRVALATLALFGVCFATLSLATASLAFFYLLWFITGLLGGGSTPVTWTRAVNGWFAKNRGLALAITLLGTGITAAFLPTFATWMIGEFGWRRAFIGVALLPLAVALPIAWLWFREPPQDVLAAQAADQSQPQVGLTLREALATYRFWVMMLSVILVSLGIGGTITNLQPLLIDKGFTAANAAQIAGAIGVSIIVGRLLAGFLMDRFWAPAVVFPMLILPALACLLLIDPSLGYGSAVLAAALVGFASGAETDLVAYLSARYFGLRHYGKVYGVQYAAFGLASGIAPALFGRVFDSTGSYDPILYSAAAAFFIGAAVLLTMGRYPK